jgi:hypothetical protein
MYAAVKVAAIYLAFESQASWHDVLNQSWDSDDFGLFTMCVSFWFVGRSIEKYQKQ